MKFFDRIPNATNYSLRDTMGNQSPADKQSECEHKLQIVGDKRIECVNCGAEWKDMGL